MKEIFIVIGGPDETIKEILMRDYPQLSVADCIFIGVDGGCCKLMALGYPIDVAIGDFDSVTKQEKQQIAAYAKELVSLPCEKDETDFEASLHWCVKHYPQQPLHVLGAFGGRIDHELSTLWIVYQPKFKKIVPYLRFESLTNKVSFLTSGKHQLQKYPDMKYLSFITMGKVTNLSLTNVKYPLKDATYDAPMAFISNEFITDTMTISFDEGVIMTCQTKD